MRRNVRYTPLGKSPKLFITHGLGGEKRIEAKLMNESQDGYGIHVDNAAGINVGSNITLEFSDHRISGRVARMEISKQGGFELGICTKRSTD